MAALMHKPIRTPDDFFDVLRKTEREQTLQQQGFSTNLTHLEMYLKHYKWRNTIYKKRLFVAVVLFLVMIGLCGFLVAKSFFFK